MKTKLYKYLIISLVAVFGITGFTSCGDDITEQYYEGNVLVNKYITVNKNQWKWNDEIESYEYSTTIPELTLKVYNDGAVVASAFVNPDTDDERMELLPYPFTYLVQDNEGKWYTYTENVSCSLTPGNVTFYIQASDRLEGGIAENYEFKISLIGDASLF